VRSHGKASPAATAGSTTPQNGSTFSFGVLVAILACAAAFLGIGAPAASAAPEAEPGWSYRNSFGSIEPYFFDPSRSPVGVDQHGNIFVVEQNSGVAKVYSPSGEFLTTAAGGTTRNIAIDLDDDALYTDEVVAFGGSLIRRYLSDGQPTPTYSAVPGFEIPQGDAIAVDPVTHDLLVADSGAEAVRRYDTAGTLVGTTGTPGINPSWLVTAPDGSFFVAPAEGPDVTHFSSAGTQLNVLAGVGPLNGLAFDSSRSLVVVSAEGKIKTYSPAGPLLSEVPSQTAEGLGLIVDAGSGLLYEHARSTINAYVPATVPGVEAPIVSAITADSAHVSVEVDPGAGPPEGSAVQFEYSEDGGKSWTPLPDQEVSAASTYEADLTNLTLNWGFQVRAKAFNSLVSSTSAAVSFATPEIAPLVVTGVATDRTEASAVLNGTVNPAGQLTTYHFEYGPTDAYGSRIPVANEAPAGNTRQPRSISWTVTGLQPETTYHYRLVASNSTGETVGSDRTFTTVGPTEAPPPRAYEQVSPVDQHGALVNGAGHFWAAADGSWFVTGSGAAEPDGTSSLMWQHFLSRRGPTGWSDWVQIDPPRSIGVVTFEGTVAAVSDDGTHALVVSNRVLDQGGIDDGGNFYVYDIDSGEYMFVGGAPGAFSYQQLAGLQKAPEIFVWGSQDFSSIVFRSAPPLLPGVTGPQFYRWNQSAGLELESVMPDGEPPLGETSPPTSAASTHRQVSDNGNVSYFSINGPDFGVYRRAGGQTTAISVVEGDTTQTPQFGELLASSRDGRYAVFTTFIPLTSDTPAAEPPLMYRYDAVSEEVTYLGKVGFGTSAVHAISDDGLTVYFNDGSDNLFVSRGNQTRALGSDPAGNPGVTSPSGRYYARVNLEGKAMLYDAEADTDVCVSCLSDGSAGARAYLFNPGRNPGNRVARVVLDNGMLVFSTRNQLTAGDHNGAFDVYAYQHGRLTLISPGDGPYDARIAEASLDGADIFFTTDEALLGQDINGVTDMYDARVGSGFPGPAPITECDGEACKGPLAAAPAASGLGSSALGEPRGSKGAATAIAVRKLTASDRATLARGGKAHLRVKVSGPGRVTVTGKASGSAKAKKAGVVSVPISLSKGTLSELRTKESLTLSLTVHFQDAKPKALSVTLRSTTSKKGGSR
jgi:hypothetical protein